MPTGIAAGVGILSSLLEGGVVAGVKRGGEDAGERGVDGGRLVGFGVVMRLAGVGERTREGNDLYNEMAEAGVINLKDISKSKVALFLGQRK